MEPHLYLRRGKKCILLVRYYDRLHFVTLDHRMHQKVRVWFLEQPRTEKEMDDKGLVRTVLDLKDIRGVAAGGTGRGQVVQFYLKEGKRRYELDKDCTLADMDGLFYGLESFEPPKRESNWQDPRMARQNPNLRKRLWALGFGLNLAACASGFYIWIGGFENDLICWNALLCIFASAALYCLFPDYYTIFLEKRKYGQKKAVMGLLAQFVCPTGMILGSLRCYGFFNWWKAWGIGAAVIVVLAGMLYLIAPVFRETDKILAVLTVGFLLSGGPVLMMNRLLDPMPVQENRTEVADMQSHTSSKAGTTYEITVLLNGDQMDIPVDGVFYRETKPGDSVTVDFHEGAFGIGFAAIRE